MMLGQKGCPETTKDISSLVGSVGLKYIAIFQ